LNLLKLLKITVGLAPIALLLQGCFTPAKEQALRGEIFNVQTRVANVEDYLQKKSGDQEFKVASTQTRLDQMQLELQRIHGEIDALKVAVTTGKMPGVEEAPEGSLAEAVATLTSRIDEMEERQNEILEAIKKAGGSSKSARDEKSKEKDESGKDKKGGNIGKEIKDFKAAFSKQRFKYVIDNGPSLIGKGSKKDQEEVLFMYAEGLYRRKKLRDAALQYNDYVQKFSSSGKVPYAKMRMGDCFRHLGDSSTAKLYYNELIEKHPKSEEAAKAKERLKGLKS
jgi:TolA-binding protein